MLEQETLFKIDALREKGLHDIMFRNAGIGMLFFEPPPEYDTDDLQNDPNWRRHLHVKNYHASLKEAVDAEFETRCGELSK